MAVTLNSNLPATVAHRFQQNCDFFISRINELIRGIDEGTLPSPNLKRAVGLVHRLEEALAEMRREKDSATRGAARGNTGREMIVNRAFQEALDTAERRTAHADENGKTAFSGKAFTVSEVLQFLGVNRKSGTVTIALPKERVTIRLVDGDISHASSDRSPPGLRLGEILVAQGALDPRRLTEFLIRQPGKSAPLGRNLIEQSIVSEDAICNALHHQMKELFRRCLDVPDVDVVFEPASEEAKDLDFSTNLVALLLEGAAAHDTEDQPAAESSLQPTMLVGNNGQARPL